MKAEEIVPVITGKMVLPDGVHQCEEMDIARFKDGALDGIACDGPCHGVHQRFAGKFDELYQKHGKIIKRPVPADCGKCGGSGWLSPDDDNAKAMVAVCAAIGLFRGIKVDTGLIDQGDNANLMSFLNGAR